MVDIFRWNRKPGLGRLGRFILFYDGKARQFILMAGRFVSHDDISVPEADGPQRFKPVAAGSFNEKAEIVAWSSRRIDTKDRTLKAPVTDLFSRNKDLIKAEWKILEPEPA